MHHTDPSSWTHAHAFDGGNLAAEKGTRLVMLITALMMVVEIAAGWWFNSMALLADGWHMSSHAVAIGLSALAYAAARRYAGDGRFAFGTWKIEILAGFASAIFLLGVALMMVVGSVERIFRPQPIQFAEAIVVAVIGLAVNIVCALILGSAHDHHADHGDHPSHAAGETVDHAEHSQQADHHDHHHHEHHHHDLNLRSAYLHVLADAATSVLAIIALVGGMAFGWDWLDPLMGIVGAVLVARWALGLIRDTGRVLLDREMDHPVVEQIRATIANAGAWAAPPDIVDLHVWRVGRDKFAVIVSLVTGDPAVTPARIRQLLSSHAQLAHVSVEVNHAMVLDPPNGAALTRTS
ncbi:CDF family Co(II)/Ni(II) efflux transporter DmeF [Accumulibacter sp.]|uniref:CDF family Co(II)/Ni(II) efflux transporter DmeF n=1 Tax=Accumulibacter sp. TaxID=2053492 RepID=UPI0025FD6E7C|nr:CDF family Co(II)/Ni(II) efflux transporter DmeF [Accumulibacter sp.]MCM8625353.1 CDF family Co(II)/Ni(II) efflux transporter DmeF [Accumulibacter sp.]